MAQHLSEGGSEVPAVSSADLYLVPGKVSNYTLMFVTLPEDVNKQIEVGTDMQA